MARLVRALTVVAVVVAMVGAWLGFAAAQTTTPQPLLATLPEPQSITEDPCFVTAVRWEDSSSNNFGARHSSILGYRINNGLYYGEVMQMATLPGSINPFIVDPDESEVTGVGVPSVATRTAFDPSGDFVFILDVHVEASVIPGEDSVQVSNLYKVSLITNAVSAVVDICDTDVFVCPDSLWRRNTEPRLESNPVQGEGTGLELFATDDEVFLLIRLDDANNVFEYEFMKYFTFSTEDLSPMRQSGNVANQNVHYNHATGLIFENTPSSGTMRVRYPWDFTVSPTILVDTGGVVQRLQGFGVDSVNQELVVFAEVQTDTSGTNTFIYTWSLSDLYSGVTQTYLSSSAASIIKLLADQTVEFGLDEDQRPVVSIGPNNKYYIGRTEIGGILREGMTFYVDEIDPSDAVQNVDGLLEVTANTIATHEMSEADFDERYLYNSPDRTWPVSNDLTPPITAAVAMTRSCASISPLWSGGDLAGWVKFIIAMSVIIVVACVCCCVCYAVTRAETPAADQQPVELYNRRETVTGKEQFEKPEVTKVGGGTGDDDLPAYEDVV